MRFIGDRMEEVVKHVRGYKNVINITDWNAVARLAR
jgi:hypothetical protein